MLSDCFTTFLWVFYDIFMDFMQRKYVENAIKIRTLSVAVMMMARMKLLDELFIDFVQISGNENEINICKTICDFAPACLSQFVKSWLLSLIFLFFVEEK